MRNFYLILRLFVNVEILTSCASLYLKFICTLGNKLAPAARNIKGKKCVTLYSNLSNVFVVVPCSGRSGFARMPPMALATPFEKNIRWNLPGPSRAEKQYCVGTTLIYPVTFRLQHRAQSFFVTAGSRVRVLLFRLRRMQIFPKMGGISTNFSLLAGASFLSPQRRSF